MEHKEQDQVNERELDFRVFMAETVVYRKEQKERMDRMSVKVDRIFDKLDELPCRERAYLSDQVRAIWVFIGAIVLAVIGAWIKK
jgi:hypothetical protein